MKRLFVVAIVIMVNIFLSSSSGAEGDFVTYKLHWPQEAGSFKFKSLKGIAVDSLGDVYVADAENYCIHKFNSNGQLINRFEGPAFNKNGQTFLPTAIAIFKDKSGYNQDTIYVVEANNNRIQKFDKDGSGQRVWGVRGVGHGQFISPQSISVDRDGNVYVADTGNNRIQKFSREGVCITSSLTGDYKLSSPQDIAFDLDSNEFFVLDPNNNRLLKFDSQGKLIFQIATYTTLLGTIKSLNYPTGISVNRGVIYITDKANPAIKVFDMNGGFIGEWGSNGVGEGKFEDAQEIAVYSDSSDTYIYITDARTKAIQKFTDNGGYIDIWSEYSSKQGRFHSPTDLAIDSNDNIYVLDTDNHRVQKFDSKGRFAGVIWGEKSWIEMKHGTFDSPGGIAIDKSDNNTVYIADTNNNRIQVFKADGTYLNKWGRSGINNDDALDGPMGITVNDGNIYLVDRDNSRIKVFKKNGTLLQIWNKEEMGGQDFQKPLKIAINSKGKVYVVDNRDYCLKIFDKMGNFLGKLGSFGNYDGSFLSPIAVAIDSKDRVYVLDAIKACVQVFDQQNNFITKFGNKGVNPGEFILPQGIAIDSKDNIYIADTDNHRVQKFSLAESPISGSGSDSDLNEGATVTSTGAIDVYNYPNPFNPNKAELTKIVYPPGKVTIRIYNLAGELVKTVCEDKTGSGEEPWDGKIDGEPAPSGIYLGLVKTQDKTSVCKIAVIKE